MRFPMPAGRRLRGPAAVVIFLLVSAPAGAQRSETAPPPRTAAEARARALLLETDRETLAPPEWGVLRTPQPLAAPSAAPVAITDRGTTTTAAAPPPAAPGGAPNRPIDPVVVAMIALGAGSLATLLVLALTAARRDRDHGPQSILPR